MKQRDGSQAAEQEGRYERRSREKLTRGQVDQSNEKGHLIFTCLDRTIPTMWGVNRQARRTTGEKRRGRKHLLEEEKGLCLLVGARSLCQSHRDLNCGLRPVGAGHPGLFCLYARNS